MSREEAIEILSEMRAEYNLFGDEEEATRYHVLSWAIQAMKAAPRWIPVSESLPEEGKQVLVCDDGGFIYTAEGETRSDGEWQWYESVEYRPMDDVMAWMPLPKP